MPRLFGRNKEESLARCGERVWVGFVIGVACRRPRLRFFCDWGSRVALGRRRAKRELDVGEKFNGRCKGNSIEVIFLFGHWIVMQQERIVALCEAAVCQVPDFEVGIFAGEFVVLDVEQAV